MMHFLGRCYYIVSVADQIALPTHLTRELRIMVQLYCSIGKARDTA